jgi:hypothetical protein
VSDGQRDEFVIQLADKVEKRLLQTLSKGDIAMLENFGGAVPWKSSRACPSALPPASLASWSGAPGSPRGRCCSPLPRLRSASSALSGRPPPCRRPLRWRRCAGSAISEQPPSCSRQLRRRWRHTRRHRRSLRRRRIRRPRPTPRYCPMAWCVPQWGRLRARVSTSSPRVLVLARQAHGDPTAARTASESRLAEARIAPKKETAGNSRKGSSSKSQRNQKAS